MDFGGTFQSARRLDLDGAGRCLLVLWWNVVGNGLSKRTAATARQSRTRPGIQVPAFVFGWTFNKCSDATASKTKYECSTSS